MAKLLDQGDIILVDLFPEPEMKYSSNAIVLECLVDGSWHRIGCVEGGTTVRTRCYEEAANSIHEICLGKVHHQLELFWSSRN